MSTGSHHGHGNQVKLEMDKKPTSEKEREIEEQVTSKHALFQDAPKVAEK